MKIRDVDKDSPASHIGLRPGDDLLSINHHPIRDPLDLQFYAADDRLVLLIERDGLKHSIPLENHDGGWLGIELEDMKYRCCGNDCVFCFVDQNPAGLRRSLYFKDEDYRLSFLYGNYVTLTNVSSKDLQRIVDQRLSPLYLSVHATELAVRKKLLGLRADDHLFEKIALLAKAGIEMHVQIVLCPGWNDGAHLDRTVEDLAAFHPAVATVAIVPVGLTRHRRGLPFLRSFDRASARRVVDWGEFTSARFLAKLETRFIFLADEFYLLAGRNLPDKRRYEGFAQIENGVGMMRSLLDRFRRQRRWLPKKIIRKKLTLITGALAAPILEREILPWLKAVDGLSVSLVAIENRFYGGRVGVSGLLVGQDIAAGMRNRHPGDLLALPPNCLNIDGCFLDDWTPNRLSRHLNVAVHRSQYDFLEIVKQLA